MSEGKELKYAFFSRNIWSSKFDALPIPKGQHLSDFLVDKFDQKGQNELFIDSDTGTILTADRVKQLSFDIASALYEIGLQPGDVVFGYCPNTSIHACTILASLFAGLIHTGCMWSHPLIDLLHQVNDSKAKLIFACKENIQTVIDCIKQANCIKTIILIDDSYDSSYQLESVEIFNLNEFMSKSRGKATELKLPRYQNPDPKKVICFLHYSSGSTGLRKGAIKYEESFFHSLMVPYLHVNELNFAIIHSIIHTSGCNLLLKVLSMNSKLTFFKQFNPISFLEAIDKFKITHSSLVPTQIIELTKVDKSNLNLDLSSFESVSTVGSRLPTSIIDDFKKIFPFNLFIQQVYATTETNIVTMTSHDCNELNSVGALYPGNQAKIVDLTTGQLLGPNETGEVYVKTLSACSSYLNRPEESREVFLENGWIKTGDIGYFDEVGRLFLVDRIKDMIKTSGVQVPPSELEAILLSHPLVKEASIIGVPDEYFGEVPRAFVVPKISPEEMDGGELINFVNSRVADLKKIRGGLFFIDQIPKLGIGKIDRQILRNMKYETEV